MSPPNVSVAPLLIEVKAIRIDGRKMTITVFQQIPTLGLVLGMAMIINMFVAAAAGTLVPLGLRAANVDPALASSVFITTMTDMFGFFSFLGLATVFARYLV